MELEDQIRHEIADRGEAVTKEAVKAELKKRRKPLKTSRSVPGVEATSEYLKKERDRKLAEPSEIKKSLKKLKTKEGNVVEDKSEIPLKDKPNKRFLFCCMQLNKRLKNDTTASIPTRSGSSYKYSYCSLNQVLDLIHEVFTENGLAVYQSVVQKAEGNTDTIETEVVDMANEKNGILPVLRRSSITIPHLPKSERLTNQDIGSAITYFRRYALYTLLNFFPEEDKDGR